MLLLPLSQQYPPIFNPDALLVATVPFTQAWDKHRVMLVAYPWLVILVAFVGVNVTLWQVTLNRISVIVYVNILCIVLDKFCWTASASRRSSHGWDCWRHCGNSAHLGSWGTESQQHSCHEMHATFRAGRAFFTSLMFFKDISVTVVCNFFPCFFLLILAVKVLLNILANKLKLSFNYCHNCTLTVMDSLSQWS